jgi:hypothetical protein
MKKFIIFNSNLGVYLGSYMSFHLWSRKHAIYNEYDRAITYRSIDIAMSDIKNLFMIDEYSLIYIPDNEIINTCYVSKDYLKGRLLW